MTVEEWTGHWWLPETPDSKISGVLKQAKNNQLTLSLIGGFRDITLTEVHPGVAEVTERSEPWAVIHGLARGKKITLLNCASRDSKTFGWGLTPHEQNVIADDMLIGIHLSAADQEIFSAAEVRIERLRQWSAASPFNLEQDLAEGKWTGSAAIKAKCIPAARARVDEITISLQHSHTPPKFEERHGEQIAHMADRPALHIKSTRPRALGDIQNDINILQDLISFAAHSACGVISRTLIVSSKVEGHPPIRIQHFARQVVQSNPPTEPASRSDFLFTLADISFEDIISSWFKVRKIHAIACNMLLGLWYVPDTYLQTQILTAVTAAEAMHAGLKLPPPIPANEFNELKNAIRNAVPESRRQWAANLLARNSHSLHQGLTNLAARPDQEAITKVVANIENWVRAAKRARNAIAHGGSTDTEDVNELFTIVAVTRSVILLNLLHDLGLPPDVVRKTVRVHKALRDVSALAEQFFGERSD